MKVISKKEAVQKGLSRYYTGEACKKGHLSERYTNGGGCIDCLKENKAKRIKQIYSDPEKLDAFRKQCRDKQRRYLSNPEYRKRQNELRKKAYWSDPEKRQKCLDLMKDWNSRKGHTRYEAKKRWSEENKDKRRAYEKKYRENNPEKSSMYSRIWAIKRRQAMPEWVNKKHIEDFYATVNILNKACGKTKSGQTAYHVDHIIPLRHPDVCGLHVPWNLQVLPAEMNLRKSNKLS